MNKKEIEERARQLQELWEAKVIKNASNKPSKIIRHVAFETLQEAADKNIIYIFSLDIVLPSSRRFIADILFEPDGKVITCGVEMGGRFTVITPEKITPEQDYDRAMSIIK